VLYANHLGFYTSFNNHSAETIQQANTLTREFLKRCKLAIFSSEWAARGAIETYGADKNKVRVVPYGANILEQPDLAFVKACLHKRSRTTVKLLFLGKPWERKGGDTVLKVANALHAAGQPVELHIVGCNPPAGTVMPDYVTCHGFISKRTPEGMHKITSLLTESHFLFVPTQAEAFGIVFCEANAYGLPCLTSYVGGVPVKDHINGMTFALDASTDAYCQYITHLMQHYSQYEELALSSFHEYETHLNWNEAVKTVKEMISDSL
jgi:glycosyltransferase involved in cell wall biosynthesis